nr:conjugative transposon protein TraK [uncultured Pedobacter sp.]
MADKHPLSDLKNIDRAYKINKSITIIAVVGIIVTPLISLFYANKIIEENRSKVYTLVNGNALLLAERKDANDNRPAEIKHHIKMFLDLMFTLSPDRTQIEQNSKQALYLGDNSVRQFVDQLKEQKYYDKMISANAVQYIKLDTNSIQVDFSSYPYKAMVTAQQQIERPTTITLKELKCTMNLRNIPRSDNNPHGLLIEKFEVTSNNTIQSYDREH